MLRIDVGKVKPGMKLALPVQNPKVPSRTLLKMGYELSVSVVDRLREYGIKSVWVRYPSLDFLASYINTETQKVQSEVVTQIASTFESLQSEAAAKLPYDTYTQTLQSLVDHLGSNPQTAIFLGDLADAGDDQLMRHSSSVTYLSLLLGMKLEGYLVRERKRVNPARAKDVTSLGMGAMLHDVGVTLLDPQVRQRYEETGDESDPQWQQHPAKGFELVRSHVDPSAATVVLNHHQRYDGSGYVGGDFPVLSEKSVHVFARIAAVADQFDMLRYPAGMPEQPTVWALSAMASEPMQSRFDLQVLRALLAVVPPYPPGSLVKLSDERWGVCVDHHPMAPCRPTVQIIPDPATLDGDDLPAGPTVNLSETARQIHIAEHDGHDVSDMNFNPPRFAGDLESLQTWM